MTILCKHCGKEIHRTNWYDGPGWKHSGSGIGSGLYCPPTTVATPPDDQEDG